MGDFSGPSDHRDQSAVAVPNDDSGPGDPRDTGGDAVAGAEGSGPGDPRDQSALQTEVTITSGPGDPRDSSALSSPAVGGAKLESYAPVPTQRTSQSVSVRLSINKPHPFSVYLSSPEAEEIQIKALEIHVWNNGPSVFNTVLALKDPITLAPGASNVFPFTDQQLSSVLPKLQVGTSVEIELSYSAPIGSKLTIGIIGRDAHNTLGTFIDRLFHSEQ
jgi:hypothetical protein